MSLIGDVEAYEAWLGQHCHVVERGLEEKHRRMAGDAFMFFRATCFRFARKFNGWFPDLEPALKIPSVGDAHVENFGTWRDAEGRLVWGVNDFDEAAILPWTHDLIRLATSARLAPGLGGAQTARAEAILQGYQGGLENPAPLFVDDTRPWLLALCEPPGATGRFERDLSRLEDDAPPLPVAALLRRHLPPDAVVEAVGSWQKGGGSLGRPRYVMVARWHGGTAVREAKALVPSAWAWAEGKIPAAGKTGDSALFMELTAGPYRSADPHLVVEDGFVVRRIAADSLKIELKGKAVQACTTDLLRAMGAELAALHAAGGAPGLILRELRRRETGWLHAAARTAEGEVVEDFARWQAWYEDHS